MHSALLGPVRLLYLVVFGAAALGCAVAVWRASNLPVPDVRRSLVAFLGCSAIWAGAYVGYVLVPSPGGRYALYTLGLVVGFLSVGAWLWFCSAYAGRDFHRRVGVQRVALVVFGLVTITKVTNPIHGLYFTIGEASVPFDHLAVDHLGLYWISLGAAYVLAGIGLFLLFESFIRVRAQTWPLAVLVGVSGVAGLLNAVGYASNLLLNISHEPLGVAVFAVGALIFYEGKFRDVQLLGTEEKPALIVGPEGTLRSYNQAALATLPGLKGQTARGRLLQDTVPELAAVLHQDPPMFSHAAEADESRAPRRYEVTESPFGGPAGGGRLLVLTDVTERELRREELHRDRRMLSKAINQAQEAVLITEARPLEDPGPRISYVNEAFEDMTGYTEEEVLGKTPRILQGPETDREVLDSLRAALEAGQTWEGETVNYRKDGTPYLVQWDISPVVGEDGDIERWVSVQRDVSERRRREDALRRQRNLLEQTQKLAGAWEVDLRAEEMDCTEEVYRIYELEPGAGLSLEEIFDFFPPEGREKIRRAYDRCTEEGTPYDVEVPLVTAQDNRRWVRAVGAPAKTEGGEVLKVSGALQDITERKEAERELRRSQEQLSMALEGGNIGTWNWDLETDEVIFNRQWAEMLGYSREELDFEFQTWKRLVHPEDLRRATDVLERYVEGETDRYDLEIRMRTKSGEWKWIQTIGKVVKRNSSGAATRIAGIHLDIDERKRAEEALRKREVQLRGVTNSIPGVVFQAYARPGRDYGFHYVSDRAEEVMGIDPASEDFFERCMRRAPESERGRLMDVIDEAVEQEAPLEFEAPFVKPSGETIWLLGTATPELRPHELVYNGVILDISQRKRQQARLATTVERVTDAIIELDAEWRFTLVNDQAENLIERAEEDLLGEQFWDVFEDALGTRFEEEYRQVMQTREPAQIEEYYSGLDGWFDVQVYPNDDGGLALYFEDITDRKERERELRAAKEEAEEANRLKSVFLANMSHEIRTPLTSILGFAEAIGDEIDPCDEGTVSQFARLIQKSGQRLMDTLTGVLNLSKLQAGEMSLDLGPVDVVTEATEAVEEFAPQARDADIDLTVSASKRSQEQACWARADAGGLQIALRNLLSNAIKYTPPGGKVQVRVRSEEEMVVLEVEDTGIGMEPETVSRLFEAFKQASEGIGRKYEGTGLGLTVTQEVLDQMGGTIEVETEKDEGSRFTIRLPRADRPDADAVAEEVALGDNAS
jgi:PAS domain S-box-containing protein